MPKKKPKRVRKGDHHGIKCKPKGYLVFLCLFVIIGCIHTPNKKENEEPIGVLYGKDHVFMVKAPEGWVIDNESGVSQGSHAVFYPEGSSWQESLVVMYVSTAHKENEGNETIEKLIEYDISQFRKNSPTLKVVDAASLKTKKDKEAIVKYFSGDMYNNYEAVAYIDESKVIVMIVLSSRTEEGFYNSLSVFETLVGSYLFIAEDDKGFKEKYLNKN